MCDEDMCLPPAWSDEAMFNGGPGLVAARFSGKIPRGFKGAEKKNNGGLINVMILYLKH